MARIVYFTIQADDVERAVMFYSKAFGWRIELWDGVWENANDFWLIDTGTETEPGLQGTLMKRAAPADSMLLNGFMVGIESRAIDDDLEAVVKNGGQSFSGKITIPGVGWVAYCQDTERNFFELRQMDETAA